MTFPRALKHSHLNRNHQQCLISVSARGALLSSSDTTAEDETGEQSDSVLSRRRLHADATPRTRLRRQSDGIDSSLAAGICQCYRRQR